MNEKTVTNWQIIQHYFQIINHFLIVVLAIFMSTLSTRLKFEGTALHVFLTFIGYHILMAEALISHYPLNALTKPYTRRTKTNIHSVLQIIGGLMALTGSFIKFNNTYTEHFTTLHGKIGLAGTFMCTASLIGGFVNYYQPKLAHRLYPPSEIKYRHNLFGMLTFSLGMASILLGYQTQFFYRNVGQTYVLPFSIITLLVYILTLISPMTSLMNKRKYRNVPTTS